jgi:hypothetical protein
MRLHTRALSAALAATLLVAACGSDDTGTGTGAGDAPTESAVGTTLPDVTDDTTPDTTPETTPDTTADTTPATTEPEEAAQDVDADTAAAEAALISVATLPEGWTETPRAIEAAATLDARLAECLGVDGDRISAADAAASSARFVSPEGNLVVVQDVGVHADEREARSVVALLVEPDVPACVEAAYGELATEALGGTVAAGATFGPATVARLQVGSVGDATQALRVVVPVTGDPSITALTIDHVVVRSGRALSSLTFENRTEATPVETIDAVTAAVAAGLPA